MQTKHYKFTTVNQRENNEDSCLAYDLIVDNRLYSILLLSDGMGGHDYGEIISNTVMSNLSMLINKSILDKAIIPQLQAEETEKKSSNLDFENVLHQAIEVTNHKVRQLVTNNKWKNGGATLVAVIIFDNNKFVWGYLGDSRLYQYNANEKKLNQIGFDHNVPGILLNEGAITPEIAKNHAQKNEIVYYMGIETIPDLKKVRFVGTGELKDNDILFLFTDGMINKLNLTSFESQMPLVSHLNIKNVFNAIVDFTQKQGEKDNQTMVAYLNSEPPKIETKKVETTEKEITKKEEPKEVAEKEKSKELEKIPETEKKTVKDEKIETDIKPEPKKESTIKETKKEDVTEKQDLKEEKKSLNEPKIKTDSKKGGNFFTKIFGE